MQYQMNVKVEWTFADGSIGVHNMIQSVRAVSRKHALDKALAFGWTLPCAKDRADAGIQVSVEVSIDQNVPPAPVSRKEWEAYRLEMEPNEVYCPQ